LTGALHVLWLQVVTTNSITLSSNKIQNGDILVLANIDSPGKMTIKMDRESDAIVEFCWIYCLSFWLYLVLAHLAFPDKGHVVIAAATGTN